MGCPLTIVHISVTSETSAGDIRHVRRSDTPAGRWRRECQPGGSGPQVAVPLPIPDIIRVAMGQEEHGGVPNGGTQGANPFGPEMMRMYVATSTQGGRRVLSGDGAGREQPGARAPLGSPPRRSLNLGGRVRFIIGYF